MPDNNYLSLLSIEDSINKIMAYSKEFTNADEFNEDVKSFDAVMMNFIIIGEQTIKLDDSFKEINTQVNWQKIKAFRNIVAHEYFGINAEEVWQIINNHLPELKENISALIKKLEK